MSSANTFQRQLIRASDVMIPFTIICSLNILLLLTLTILDPLMWNRVPADGDLDSSSSSNISYGTCWYNLTTTQIWLLLC